MSSPRDLYAAVRTDTTGVVVQVVGPFLDKADATAHVVKAFDGHGHPAPFELVFRSP